MRNSLLLFGLLTFSLSWSAQATNPTSIGLVQLSRGGAGTGSVLTWQGSAWAPGNGAGNYSANFASATTIAVPQSVHGINSKNLLVACYDNAAPANEIDCAASVDPTSHLVTIAFPVAQSGSYVINGSGIANAPNYAKAFTALTILTISAEEHNLGTNRLLAQCYDSASPANDVDGVVSVDMVTYLVTVKFAVAQSGYCVVNGR